MEHYEVWDNPGWLPCFAPRKEGSGMHESFMIDSALLPLPGCPAQGLWEAEVAVVLLP